MFSAKPYTATILFDVIIITKLKKVSFWYEACTEYVSENGRRHIYCFMMLVFRLRLHMYIIAVNDKSSPGARYFCHDKYSAITHWGQNKATHTRSPGFLLFIPLH